MSKQWQQYSDSFLQLTIREQYLILLTGLVAVIFCLFYFFIDENMIENTNNRQKIRQLEQATQRLTSTAAEYKRALKEDVNKATREQIAQLETKISKTDSKLLALTSELIDPIQMRYALLELLKVKPGVTLKSFELIGAQPLLTQTVLTQQANSQYQDDQGDIENNLEQHVQESTLNLYRHGIKLKLSGSYFDLRDYLQQLEQLSWTFFWQDFSFTMTEYPMNEVEIEIYSLGTKEDFVGV